MQDEWLQTATLPPLAANELQLWRVDTATADTNLSIYLQHLSPEEQERASRLRAGQVRMQFVVARACLRCLLASHLNLKPKDVPIILSSYGKPETPSIDGNPLFFNVAHSRSTIVIALCGETPVGVDLEYLDRDTDVLEIASTAFTPLEFSAIEDQPDQDLRRRAFFNCWTRKEAIIKADGRGLSLPLSSFNVPVVEPANATPVSVPEIGVPGDGVKRSDYFLSDLHLGEQIAGAFALQSAQCQVVRYAFPLASV